MEELDDIESRQAMRLLDDYFTRLLILSRQLYYNARASILQIIQIRVVYCYSRH